MKGSIIRETKSRRLVLSREEAYGLIEGYYGSGELPSEYYNRVGMSEAQFYKWRKRYLSEHPRLAERLGVTVRKDGGLSHSRKVNQSSKESSCTATRPVSGQQMQSPTKPYVSGFARMEVLGSETSAPGRSSSVSGYELCYPNGVVLRLPACTVTSVVLELIRLY